jgi:hypothetical protein
MQERERQQHEASFEEMAETVRDYLDKDRSARIAFQKSGTPLSQQEIRPQDYSHLVEGVITPSNEVRNRINDTFSIIIMLTNEGEDPTLIQDWFDHANPDLDGLTPVEAIGIDSRAVRIAAYSLIKSDYYHLPG